MAYNDITIRDMIAAIKDIGFEYRQEYQEVIDAGVKRSDFENSVSLVEYLTGAPVTGSAHGSKSFFSLDTNLSAPMQDLQILKDLSEVLLDNEGKEKLDLDRRLQSAIISVLEKYPPYKVEIEKTKTRYDSVYTLINAIADPLIEKNMDAIEEYRHNPKHKRFENLKKKGNLSGEEASGMFSHKTIKAKKIIPAEKKLKNLFSWFSKDWFAKFIDDKSLALHEVVAQEMMRLITPYQPKTRISKKQNGDVYVQSQKSPGSEGIEKMDRETLSLFMNHGQYTGLGRMLIMCLLLHETDAKLGNILVDREDRLIKIDGDRCFSGLLNNEVYPNNYKITAKDISQLPLITAYKPNHWLDIYESGKFNNYAYESNIKEHLIEKTLPDKPFFRREINETLLKLLLVPSDLIGKLIESYTNDKVETKILKTELVQRIEQFRLAALNEKSFQQYVTSNAGKKYYKKCIEEFMKFKTTSKNFLFKKEMTSAILGKFRRLHNTAKENMLNRQGKEKKPLVENTMPTAQTHPTSKINNYLLPPFLSKAEKENIKPGKNTNNKALKNLSKTAKKNQVSPVSASPQGIFGKKQETDAALEPPREKKLKRY